jgi:hypothetical protein
MRLFGHAETAARIMVAVPFRDIGRRIENDSETAELEL